MPPPNDSKATRLKRKPGPAKDGYTTYGIIVMVLAGAVFYGSSFAVNAASTIKQEMENLQTRHETAIKRKEEVSKKLLRADKEIKQIRERAQLWKVSDDKLSKPWTINVADWLSTKAREQQPVILTEGTTSEAAAVNKRGTVEMKVSGQFGSMLKWLMDAEHELDVIRVVKATWVPRDSKTVELSLKIEVADE